MRLSSARALVLLAVVIAGCDCEGGGDLRRLSPRIELDPTEIDFGEVAVGARREAPLTVKNTGDATLRIASTRIEIGTAEERDFGGAPDEAFSVEIRDQVQVILHFSPHSV